MIKGIQAKSWFSNHKNIIHEISMIESSVESERNFDLESSIMEFIQNSDFGIIKGIEIKYWFEVTKGI